MASLIVWSRTVDGRIWSKGQTTHYYISVHAHRKEPLPNTRPTTNQTDNERAVREVRKGTPQRSARRSWPTFSNYTTTPLWDPQNCGYHKRNSSESRRAAHSWLRILPITYFSPGLYAMSVRRTADGEAFLSLSQMQTPNALTGGKERNVHNDLTRPELHTCRFTLPRRRQHARL